MLDAVAAALADHVAFLQSPHTWADLRYFVLPWAVQFVCSWLAFLAYMRLDYTNYVARTLHGKGPAATKLPTRHPLIPFWWSQLRMVPLVLFNQLVVWPLVSLLVVWPIWARAATAASATRGDGAAATAALVVTALACFAAADTLWYWCHRFLHVRNACGVRVWRDCHRDHHMAEQVRGRRVGRLGSPCVRLQRVAVYRASAGHAGRVPGVCLWRRSDTRRRCSHRLLPGARPLCRRRCPQRTSRRSSTRSSR